MNRISLKQRTGNGSKLNDFAPDEQQLITKAVERISASRSRLLHALAAASLLDYLAWRESHGEPRA